MTLFEWLAVAYFAVFVAMGARRDVPIRAPVLAAACLLFVIVARFTPWGLRAWTPHVYLVLGYWIPALFVTAGSDPRFERWLSRADASLKSQFPTPNFQGLLRTIGSWELAVGSLELAYLLCYPLVPAAFAVVFVAGDDRAVARFWIAVLLAGYACYGTLVWTDARPPRMLNAGHSTPSLVARINAFVLGRVSHQRNTFPSGHVAVSLAAALSVWTVSPAAGAGVLLVAAAIAAAAVAGRYHYLIDVLLGLAVGTLAWAASIAA